MKLPSTRSILYTFFTLCFIFGASFAIILYSRGYRLDLTKNSVKPTGLISATSDPIGAQILVDTRLRSATNNTFTIDPGWYTVQIIKEGYIGWQKKLRIQGEVVTRADAFLFPKNPSLSPLTTSGLEHPILSPDGTKIAYTIPLDVTRDGQSSKAGLWVLELVDRPLGRNRDPQLLGQSNGFFNLSSASLLWSPDSSQILVLLPGAARLYSSSKPLSFDDVSLDYQALIETWTIEKQLKDGQKLAAYKQDFINVATSSAKILSFSPDETKLLYEATAGATIPLIINPPLIGTNPTVEVRTIKHGNLYVYDSKEDKNYLVLSDTEVKQFAPSPTTKPTPKPKQPLQPIPPIQRQQNTLSPISWFPTNRHLIVAGDKKIDVMEFDRTNWITVYSGPFVDGFVAAWTNGSRLIIMTNLNPNAGTLPNLYTVNLR